MILKRDYFDYKAEITMSKRVYVTFTEKQIDEVNKLVGVLGSNEADVVNTIVAMWLYSEEKK